MAHPDIPAFMARLRTSDAAAAKAVEFTILTVARSGETLGATWKEIDFKAKLWNVPKERMKAGAPHTVPLSTAAMSILAALYENRQGDYIFTRVADKPLSNMAMMLLLRRMKHNDSTVHGFRSDSPTLTHEHMNGKPMVPGSHRRASRPGSCALPAPLRPSRKLGRRTRVLCKSEVN